MSSLKNVLSGALKLPLLRLPRSSRQLSTSLISSAPPRSFSEIPGLKGWPILGVAREFMQAVNEEKGGDEAFLHKLQMKFGPIFKLRMPFNRWNVVTSSPEAAEVVFRSEGQYPSRGTFEGNMAWIFKQMDSPPPMFFSSNEVWKKTRSFATKQVLPRRVGNFVGPLCVIAEELISHLESIQDENGNVHNLNPELYKWAFQGVSYFVYGEKIDIYSGADPMLKEFMEAALDYIEGVSKIIITLPLYKIYPTKAYKDYVKVVRRMQQAGKQILDHRYDAIKDAISSGNVDEDKAIGLLDQWLIEGKFTEEEALSQSYDMLSAAIDTTSNTASFLLYEISKHPELQERLVQEISAAVGDKENPSWDDFQKMPLIRNCVKETLRMYVPIGSTTRLLQEDAVLLGYHVPAGTAVSINMNTACRDDKLLENPEEFKPDRWSKAATEKLHPFLSLPFGFGPRSCYGRRLAELELYILLCKVLPKYQLTTNIKKLKVRMKLILKPNQPLHIKLHRRM